jgi:hypothetical protein
MPRRLSLSRSPRASPTSDESENLPASRGSANVGVGAGAARQSIASRYGRRRCSQPYWTRSFERLAVVSLVLIAFSTADRAGGNDFIASFVAALAVGGILVDSTDPVVEFAKEEGHLVNLSRLLSVRACVARARDATGRSSDTRRSAWPWWGSRRWRFRWPARRCEGKLGCSLAGSDPEDWLDRLRAGDPQTRGRTARLPGAHAIVLVMTATMVMSVIATWPQPLRSAPATAAGAKSATRRGLNSVALPSTPPR